MAITKLLRIKASSHGSPSSGLRRCISYICNPEKTDDGRLVYGNAGTDPEIVYTQMRWNKQFWDQTEGSQGYHYVISFPPDEAVTEELALQIGKEFCEELLQDNYIYILAAHTDTHHAHVHCVFDPVNVNNGKKYISPKHDWQDRIQPIVDRLCAKHRLSVLSYDESKERKSMYHAEWESLHTDSSPRANVTWNDIIREDIDVCLARSSTWEEFLSLLEDLHYDYHDRKYLSLRPYGKEKAVRSIRLGEDYSRESLLKRIGKQKEHTPVEGRDYEIYGDPTPVYRSSMNYYRRKRSYTAFQSQAWKKWSRLTHLRRSSQVPVWKYKKDIVRLGRLSDQLCYLFDHDITGTDDIRARLEELKKSRGTEAARERKLCRQILAEHESVTAATDILSEASAFEEPLPTLENIRQVSINKTLYRDVDLQKETYTIRLPGTKEYVRLYSADTRSYNDGEMLSTYLYPEAEYCIVDAEDNVLRRVTGTRLSEHFKVKEIERKERSTTWKK